MSFDYNDETHEYKYGGCKVPSVTQIIGILQNFSRINPDDLKVAQEWGTMVHSYLTVYDSGTLNLKTADPRMIPIIESWEKIKIARNWINPVLSEEKYYSKKYGFAGTMDRLFKDGVKYTLIDFKTGGHDFTNLQTAAYLNLVRENYAQLNRVDRMMIHFDVNGKATSEVYPMSGYKKDFSDFLCVMRAYQLKNRRK